MNNEHLMNTEIEKKEKKLTWVKAVTIAVAEICLILVTLLFTTEVQPSPIMSIILGTLSIVAIIYLGLIGIESIGTERYNLRVQDKADRVINAAADFGQTIDGIYKRVDDTERKNEASMKGIVQAMQVIMDYIKLQNTPPEPETPKKKK